MLSKGIDIDKNVTLTYGKKHDNVALAVKSGTVDAGTVRTDTLERMEDEGSLKVADFNIINSKKDNFPFVRSTILYPEWPMSSLAHTDKSIVKKVTDALIMLEKDSDAAKAAKIIGWTKPLDYTPVKNCMKEIKYGAFK
jgi:twitching motility protein PilJ